METGFDLLQHIGFCNQYHELLLDTLPLPQIIKFKIKIHHRAFWEEQRPSSTSSLRRAPWCLLKKTCKLFLVAEWIRLVEKQEGSVGKQVSEIPNVTYSTWHTYIWQPGYVFLQPSSCHTPRFHFSAYSWRQTCGLSNLSCWITLAKGAVCGIGRKPPIHKQHNFPL